MIYQYRDHDGEVVERSYPMGEAPDIIYRGGEIKGSKRVYGTPAITFDGGRKAFHDSTLEADRRHQRWCLQDAGVPDDAIQPAWRRELV